MGSPQYLGLSTDIPVPGDYVGTNASQIGVYRSGTWYINGQPTQYLGMNPDVPLNVPYAVRAWHCSINAC